MFIKPSSVSFVACLLAAIACIHTSAVLYTDQRSFDVKVPPVTKLTDVVAYLQQLLDDQSNPRARCDYYAIALDAFRPESKMNEKDGEIDMFKLINIANMNLADLKTTVSKIRNNRLRVILQKAALDLAEQDKLSPAASEIYYCLENNFPGSHQDTVTLRNKYENLFKQFKSILSQPASLLTGKHQHPDLMLEDLEDGVKRTVAGWMEEGESALVNAFKSRGRVPARAQHEASAAAHADAGYDDDYENEPDWNAGPQHEQFLTPEQEQELATQKFYDFLFEVLFRVYHDLRARQQQAPMSVRQRCYAYNSALAIIDALDEEELNEGYIDGIVDEVSRSLATPQGASYMLTIEAIENMEVILRRLVPDRRSEGLWKSIRACLPRPKTDRSPSNSPRRPRQQRSPNMF